MNKNQVESEFASLKGKEGQEKESPEGKRQRQKAVVLATSHQFPKRAALVSLSAIRMEALKRVAKRSTG